MAKSKRLDAEGNLAGSGSGEASSPPATSFTELRLAEYRERIINLEKLLDLEYTINVDLRAERDVATRKLAALEEALTPSPLGVSYRGKRYPDALEPEEEVHEAQVVGRSAPAKPCSDCGKKGATPLQLGRGARR